MGDNHMDGNAYWWIGLTDHARKGRGSGRQAWLVTSHGGTRIMESPTQTIMRSTNLTAHKCNLRSGTLSSGWHTTVTTISPPTPCVSCHRTLCFILFCHQMHWILQQQNG